MLPHSQAAACIIHSLVTPARMTADAPAGSLLEELDSRQDLVLDELERLNARIEQVIAEVSAWRGIEPVL